MPDLTTAERVRSKVPSWGRGLDCWEWTGYTIKGRPYYRAGSTQRPVYRWVWEFEVGPIPANHTVAPVCGNNLCVRPSHLQVRPLNSAKQFCPQGHPYSAFAWTDRTGRRHCRACDSSRR